MREDYTEKFGARAAFHTLGCKVNTYESQKMENRLIQAGYTIVPFEEVADVYVINTCSVTAIADKKSRQMIHRARRKNEDAIVVAAGCYVQQDFKPQDIDCDIIIGNDKKGEIADIIREYSASSGKEGIFRKDINAAGEEYEELFCSDGDDAFASSYGEDEKTRAFIKIQDGCNQFCTYCIIPYVRGRVRSRSASSVIAEINKLVDKGFNEVVLAGIHLSSYEDKDKGLIELCEMIDEQTNLKRLRLSSLEPRIVTEDFARRISSLSCICPHFHLSLQSGSDGVIKRMNRQYTASDFRNGVDLLRKYFDEPAITTDVIAGFPGESEDEFEECYEFVSDMRFFEMHVFPYSKRNGTKAAKMSGQLTRAEKQKRAGRLIELAKSMSKDYRQKWDQKEVEVLFEEQCEVNGSLMWRGFTREYLTVYMEADKDLANVIVKGKYDASTERLILS